MLIPGWMMVPLLVTWTQLSLQMSKAGARMWRDTVGVADGSDSHYPQPDKGNRTIHAALAAPSPSPATYDDGADGYMPDDSDMFSTNTGHADWNNGAFSLVLSALMERVVKEMQSDPNAKVRLTELQARHLREKLEGVSSFLKDHPALRERRLFISPTKPEFPMPSRIMSDVTFSSGSLKRSSGAFTLDIEQPVCPSRAEWRIVRHAKDINDTEVEVYQPLFGSEGRQWFYTVTCVNTAFRWQRDCPGCCIGINHKRYASSCKPKKTFVMAYVSGPLEKTYKWNWIQVDTSCNCAVKPLNPFDLG